MARAGLLRIWLLRTLLLVGCSGLEAPTPGDGEADDAELSGGFAAFTGVGGRSAAGRGGTAGALGAAAGRTAPSSGGKGAAATPPSAAGAAAEGEGGVGASAGAGEAGRIGRAVGAAGSRAGSAGRATAGADASAGASGNDGTSGGSSGAGELEPNVPVWFGEYVEGSGDIKALEIVAAEVRVLDDCTVRVYANGSTAQSRSIPLSGITSAADAFVLCSQQVADAGTLCDLVPTNFQFNGDDAVVLVCDGAVSDAIGTVGEDPGVAWGTGELSTVNTTLRRVCSATQGDAVLDDAFDPAVNWLAAGLDALDDLGQYCVSTAR